MKRSTQVVSLPIFIFRLGLVRSFCVVPLFFFLGGYLFFLFSHLKLWILSRLYHHVTRSLTGRESGKKSSNHGDRSWAFLPFLPCHFTNVSRPDDRCLDRSLKWNRVCIHCLLVVQQAPRISNRYRSSLFYRSHLRLDGHWRIVIFVVVCVIFCSGKNM